MFKAWGLGFRASSGLRVFWAEGSRIYWQGLRLLGGLLGSMASGPRL